MLNYLVKTRVSLCVNIFISLGGHTLQSARPRIRPCGTGPYILESAELLRLSPSSHTWPRGTWNVKTIGQCDMYRRFKKYWLSLSFSQILQTFLDITYLHIPLKLLHTKLPYCYILYTLYNILCTEAIVYCLTSVGDGGPPMFKNFISVYPNIWSTMMTHPESHDI
jgi:hypothetical protein